MYELLMSSSSTCFFFGLIPLYLTLLLVNRKANSHRSIDKRRSVCYRFNTEFFERYVMFK